MESSTCTLAYKKTQITKHNNGVYCHKSASVTRVSESRLNITRGRFSYHIIHEIKQLPLIKT